MISRAQVWSVLRVMASVIGWPFFAGTRSGSKPLSVTAIATLPVPAIAFAAATAVATDSADFAAGGAAGAGAVVGGGDDLQAKPKVRAAAIKRAYRMLPVCPQSRIVANPTNSRGPRPR